MSKARTNKAKGVSSQFLKEVTDKVNIINHLSKDSGVEVPNELEETLKELSISSSRRDLRLDSSQSFSFDEEKESSSDVASDHDHLDSSVESPSLKQLKSNNNLLCRAVKDKLQEFRILNKKSRNEGVKATKELKSYQTELKDMKGSVVEIIDEANSTKEQILKMKEKLEQENKEHDSLKYEECDMSSCKQQGPDPSNILIDQIKELHQEIFKIQSRIERSEQDLRQKESENVELKLIIEKINESFEKLGNETEENSTTCQNCEIF
jgi:DNA repair exonuclease SbcCD ATPase subunit